MKVVVDMALCAGHGLCAEAAPEVFALDDDGFNVAAGQTLDVSGDDEAAAQRGAAACPESAIQVLRM